MTHSYTDHPAFGRVKDFDALLRDIRACKAKVKLICATEAGAAMHEQEVLAHLSNAEAIVKFSTPHRPCPMRECDDTCSLCRGRRWLTRSQWAAVPEELK